MDFRAEARVKGCRAFWGACAETRALQVLNVKKVRTMVGNVGKRIEMSYRELARRQ